MLNVNKLRLSKSAMKTMNKHLVQILQEGSLKVRLTWYNVENLINNHLPYP